MIFGTSYKEFITFSKFILKYTCVLLELTLFIDFIENYLIFINLFKSYFFKGRLEKDIAFNLFIVIR